MCVCKNADFVTACYKGKWINNIFVYLAKEWLHFFCIYIYNIAQVLPTTEKTSNQLNSLWIVICIADYDLN